MLRRLRLDARYDFVTWTYAVVTRFLRMLPITQLYLCCTCFLRNRRFIGSLMKFEESALMKIVLQTHLRERCAAVGHQWREKVGAGTENRVLIGVMSAQRWKISWFRIKIGVAVHYQVDQARNVFVQHCCTV